MGIEAEGRCRGIETHFMLFVRKMVVNLLCNLLNIIIQEEIVSLIRTLYKKYTHVVANICNMNQTNCSIYAKVSQRKL